MRNGELLATSLGIALPYYVFSYSCVCKIAPDNCNRVFYNCRPVWLILLPCNAILRGSYRHKTEARRSRYYQKYYLKKIMRSKRIISSKINEKIEHREWEQKKAFFPSVCWKQITPINHRADVANESE